MGTNIVPLPVDQLTEVLFESVSELTPRVFGHVNLHGLFLLEESEVMRRLMAAAYLVHIDGMPVVWIGRLLGHPFSSSHRVTYVDWLPRILEVANGRAAKLFFLGGKPGVGDRAAHRIGEQYPHIQFAHHHGYLANADDNARVIQAVRAFRPDILFVGMGMPRQEEWIVRNLAVLPGCAVLPCGACFDYLTGSVPTPPRILGRLGLEWAYRLVVEPRRLWGRYLVEPIFLVPRVLTALRGRSVPQKHDQP